MTFPRWVPGEVEPVCITDADGMTLERSAAYDDFGRQKVSQSYTLFDSSLSQDKQPGLWSEKTSGIGASSTHTAAQAKVRLAVTNNNEYAIRQSFARFDYQPGNGQTLTATGLISAQAGCTKRIYYGYLSTTAPHAPEEGVFWEMRSGTMYLCIYKGGVLKTEVAQSNWDDPMNGSGRSGVTIDWSGRLILKIGLEWLGVGSVRASIITRGREYIVHEIHHDNDATTGEEGAYIKTASLAVGYSIHSTGSAGVLDQICVSVQSDGGQDPSGQNYSVYRDNANTLTGIAKGTKVGLIAIRLASGYESVSIKPQNASVVAVSGSAVRATLVMNPTIAGAALSWVSPANQPLQYAFGVAANTISGGTPLQTRMGNNSEATFDPNNLIRMGQSIDGTKDVLVLEVEPLGTGAAEDLLGCINFLNVF